MPTSPPTETALHWLRTEQAPPARMAEVARALALLEGATPVTAHSLRTPFGADVELALLIEADARGRFDLVDLLASHAAAKATAKHAKKLLFRARQRGTAVPDGRSTRAPVSLAARPEPLPSYASSLDGDGMQLAMLGGWTAGDGPWVLMGVMSDAVGLVSVWHMPDSSRTRQRDLLGRMQTTFGGVTVEVPTGFAEGRLRWGLDISEARGTPIEGDLAAARRLLAEAEAVDAVEVALDAEDEARVADLAATSGVLLDDPCLKGWFTHAPRLPDALRAALGDLRGRDIDESHLISARASAVGGLVNATERVQWADRLEMTAWLMATSGRRVPAVIAVAAARCLRDGDIDLVDIGLVCAALDRAAPVPTLRRWLAGDTDSPVALKSVDRHRREAA
ncbi:MAG: hypothetical protein EXR79_00660 [Myxococcales bacterium]|nr:hypothetical protein [Myxococcales bacterium]